MTSKSARPLAALSGPFALLVACAGPAPEAPRTPPTPLQADELPDARQIEWQRSLEDALALARAEDRPLLVALNMDGESASDRIVLESYRDPAFVAATHAFVCVVGTVFRHGLRDHDDQGRRIPCPRLGSVTCGEHEALEPLLYERFLADGERVAPRHALVRPDGTKVWDISLTYDLRDVDRAVAASAQERGPAGDRAQGESWAALATRRDARGRARLEAALLGAPDEATLRAALAVLAAHGDAGALDGLRIVAARLASCAPSFQAPLVACARALGLESGLAEILRSRVQQLAAGPYAPGADAALLPRLAELDGTSARTRSFVLASLSLAEYESGSSAALVPAFGAEVAETLANHLAALGGALPLRSTLQAATRVTRTAGALPRPAPIDDAMPGEAELEDALGALEASLAAADSDAELVARYAKAGLDLARRRIESGGPGALELLADAERHYGRALELAPERAEWWLERARTAYFRARFTEQVEHGARALALLLGTAALSAPEADAALLENALAIEALRWIGDGHARLLAERSGGEPLLELTGMREGLHALATVAVSPFATPTDWQSFASFAGALGLWREELAIACAGATRFPAARELRQSLNAALWNGGRIEHAPLVAELLADENPDSADALWFAGHAWLLAAEDRRRVEDPERALAAYEASRQRFEAAARLRPDYAESCRRYLALGWIGRGLAEVRCARRAAGAEALLEAVRAEPALGGLGLIDGLGYDVLDLVDKLGEWRASGPSDVDPLALLARLEPLAPGDPFWAVALSDSQLREALRADGRNPVRAERDTVDAAGLPIRMLMGVPNEEGDGYLRTALELARRALPQAQSDEDEKAFTQAATIWAERMLERGRLDGVREVLAEAAPLLGAEPPLSGAADLEALRALTAEFRAQLGEARPRWRAGR